MATQTTRPAAKPKQAAEVVSPSAGTEFAAAAGAPAESQATPSPTLPRKRGGGEGARSPTRRASSSDAKPKEAAAEPKEAPAEPKEAPATAKEAPAKAKGMAKSAAPSAGEQMTGAEMVVRALVDQGVDAHLRLSRRRGAADL